MFKDVVAGLLCALLAEWMLGETLTLRWLGLTILLALLYSVVDTHLQRERSV